VTTTHDIVARPRNLCHPLRDDCVTYRQYVTELTYLLFLEFAQETGPESAIPAGWRWGDLTETQAARCTRGDQMKLVSYCGGPP
jgi:type I restriction enzyme M protein